MIRIDAVARQPLHLGVQPDAGWLTDTHRFVPGSVLRGALAAVWLARHRPPQPDTSGDAEFLNLFEGAVRYGPLYPGGDDALRPLSVFGCKYPADAACGGVAVDAAFEEVPARCPHCDSPMDPSRGTVVGARLVEHTRVELDARGQAVDGQLFTRRALAAGTRLTGLVHGDLDGPLGWIAEPDLAVRFGGRRSTSGLTELAARPEPVPDFTGYDPQQRVLVLRLSSPGIFVDRLGRPSWVPDVEELRRLGVPVKDVDAAFVRPTTVGGWHAASNLPKPRDFAVAAGSVFRLTCDGDPREGGGLEQLWRTGVGLRRAEGFGWVTLTRWRPPEVRVAASPEADPLRELLMDVLAVGVGSEFVDDLRGYAQEGGHGERARILGARRYRRLGADARATLEKALKLPPDDAAQLVQQLSAHLTAHTSRRGGRR
jgi:CRISPR-associated protein Csx10